MKRINVFKSWLAVVLAMSALTACQTPNKTTIRESDFQTPIRVACVGDSITFGHGIKDPDRNSYPAQLAVRLGDRWQVRNFGVNGATALKNGTRPYNDQPAFREVLSFKPNVVVIELGTNDTNAKSWPAHKNKFIADYLDLIRNFEALETKPRIYLIRPTPLFRDRGKEYDTDKILTEEVTPKINEIARRNHLQLIDLYAALDTKSALFPDGVHPNPEGAGLMAEKVFQTLTGRTSSKSF
ncbi:MAG: Acetylesterase, lipase-GDSL family [Verrucomicrobiales bacterium]|nr:Acetylesterase, lipase-GDSL family [Verrucomicrobiales bacterium]